jgi:hypothetical protein
VAEASTGDYSAKKASAGKDIGKPGKMFSKIAKSAGKRYGSKESGEKVAGAVLAKLRGKNESTDQGGDVMDYLNDKLKDFDAQQSKTDESALQAYLGKKKYGDAGMKALQKAGRDGASKETMARIRAKHDKMDEEMADEGNAFTAKLKSTPKGGEFELDGKKYKDTSSIEEKKETKKSRSAGTAFDPEVAKSMFATKDEHPRYDVKDTGYSKRYTRKEEPEADKDDEVKSDEPKRKGRPKSAKPKDQEHVTKGSYKYKMVGGKRVKKEKTDEDLDTDGVMMNTPSNMSSEGIESIALVNKGEYDQEGDMAKDDLQSLAMAAKELHGILGDDENLPEWVQSKITKALDYINSSNQYMHQQKRDAEPVAEKAVSQVQRRAAGIAHAAQKGEIPKSKLRGASKEMAKMPKGELHKFAATKETGLPKKVKKTEEGNDGNLANNAKPYDKVTQGDVVAGRLGKDEMGGKKKKEEAVDETTVAGSVATAPAGGKSKGGMQFGKGVYESLDSKFRQALTEGMNVSVNMNTGPDGQPSKNITVSADGEDAEALAALLKMAGIGHKEEACSSCGKSPCGCEELDENSPDWPTNTETSDNAMQYSGGLNGPKSTGQTTVPVIASQLRRQVSMEESVKLENDLFRLYQNYKAQ